MDVDILKPDTGALQIERPLHSTSRGTSASERQGSSGVLTPEHPPQGYTEPVSEGEEDEDMDLAPGASLCHAPFSLLNALPVTAKDEVARTGLAESDVAAAIAFREKALKERQDQQPQQPPSSSKPPAQGVKVRDTLVEEEEQGDDEGDVDERTPFLKTRKHSGVAKADANARALSIDPLAPSSAFDETLRDRLREDAERRRVQEEVDEDEDEDEQHAGPSQRAMRDSERLLERNWRAPAGKKIAIPVRIEPKVYFATERTFLVSLKSCIIDMG